MYLAVLDVLMILLFIKSLQMFKCLFAVTFVMYWYQWQ